MSGEPQKTILYEIHKKLNGNVIDFHGVLLPVFYSSIQEEHNAVRTNMGLFDVSHMGNVLVTFPSKEKAIEKFNYLLPNDYSKIRPGKIIYSTLLKEDGTVIDDLLVMSITETFYHIVVNSSNIEKDYEWIKEKIGSSDIKIENTSYDTAIIALQGPNSYKLLQDDFGYPVNNLKSFEVMETKYNGKKLTISRTGYTGEDGFELYIENSEASTLFEDLLARGKKYNLIPCGLGARDTLRLEAALPLYGQELDESHSPLQAMISWSVKLNKTSDFIGKKAIIDGKDTKFSDIMLGFEVVGRSIPRTDMEILNDKEEKIGSVTSGTFSPTLKKNIGIAYIKKEYKDFTDLKIKIRNRVEAIKIIKLPFYKRNKGD
ncbi:MAG: hypothetical protein A2086_04370 [Spirochaetes bacterium GWD1_27_9]|nr:MAG: hypothetical protein A2Y34_00655 [Spirochaetes bacterium GWC1_27_15]OHD32321.1 MAG: hypothetical protein A2086_04370 [Spirochaetes bacterium GWD1_27_9]